MIANSKTQLGSSLVVLFLALAAATSRADILFESGTLGPTGIPRSDIANETVPGTNINQFVFTGVRFFLDRPVVTSQIGGHFVRNTGANDSFFGAIVSLVDGNDFPDSGDLSTPDVVGEVLLSFPEPSDEVFGDFVRPLGAGWYALVFGSGLFGSSGSGVALRNNPDGDDPAYVAWQLGTGWFNLSDLSDVINFVDHRFVVIGDVVPEPTLIKLLIPLLFIASYRRGLIGMR